ncbi:MAG: FkbM family methyltransferase, partial [Acidobacteriaceae bacterium]|nr:FkbM family methyltransferase [Acidobacteriaceae bacterium]
TIQVPVTTIDRVCREFELDRIDYIKLDIEGAELRALTEPATS